MQGSSYYWLWLREVGTEVHRDHVTGLKPQSKKLNTGNYISRFPVPNSFLCGLQFKPGVWVGSGVVRRLESQPLDAHLNYLVRFINNTKARCHLQRF